MNKKNKHLKTLLIIGLTLFALNSVSSISAQELLGQKERYRYKYISLMPALSQIGLDAFPYPAAIDERGRVYIVAFDANFNDHLVVYEDGKITELPKDGFFFPADGAINRRGTLAGVFRKAGSFQAALYKHGEIKNLPKLVGEESSVAISINDANKTLIQSTDPIPVNITYRLLKNDQTFFSYKVSGSDVRDCWKVNNRDQISGCYFDATVGGFRTLRFSPPNYKRVVLNPIANDIHSTATELNNRGDVLGYSQSNDGLINHIGIWDSNGHFTTYFAGGFHSAHFNDSNLVVLTGLDFGDPNSYLIPKPGLLLRLDELPDNKSQMLLPIRFVTDINNRGDLVGMDCGGDCAFILKRID